MTTKTIFRLTRNEEELESHPYLISSASELSILEKDLENWMSQNNSLLFGNERLLVIGQSVSGQSMADILALDADKNLIVVEIKRDWSDRSTVGQLLEYAAKMANSKYEDLEKLAHKYWQDENQSLIDKFQNFFDDKTATQENIPDGLRTYIVAPGHDEILQKIVNWLKEYEVPIDFVPFTLYTGSSHEDILLEIATLPDRPDNEAASGYEWQGDWFFNTNETYAPDAYKKMFEQSVIAIYGYESGPANLMGSQEGERVFAYVNQKGILAVGDIVDGEVVEGETIFGYPEEEFHLKVEWKKIVADDKGVTTGHVKDKFDHGLPVRNVFCQLNPAVANWTVEELRRRA